MHLPVLAGKVKSAAMWWALPWLLLGLNYLAFETAFGRLVSHPIGRLLLVAALVWAAVGTILLTRFEKNWIRTTIVLFFLAPAILMCAFGPKFFFELSLNFLALGEHLSRVQ